MQFLRDELAAGRPCVVYLRQTATRDIQPRIEALIRQHVPAAVPYILRNTVAAERRERVIEQQVTAGVNVVICNPELVKTGLDLIHFPTLIFYEITFSLGTMMQAAARAYRLNQMHQQCKTVYLFAVGTMEHTAVQLMSRKQRAAKLLTGEIGLTGLDALTEGEGGFEEALLNAIAQDDVLLDPTQLFTVDAEYSAADLADASYWGNDAMSDDAVSDDAVSDDAVSDEAVSVSEPSDNVLSFMADASAAESADVSDTESSGRQTLEQLFAAFATPPESVVALPRRTRQPRRRVDLSMAPEAEPHSEAVSDVSDSRVITMPSDEAVMKSLFASDTHVSDSDENSTAIQPLPRFVPQTSRREPVQLELF